MLIVSDKQWGIIYSFLNCVVIHIMNVGGRLLITLRETTDEDVDFIVSCLKGKGEDFCGQCGYGNRFFTYPITYVQLIDFIHSRREQSIFFTIMKERLLLGSLELIINNENSEGTIARFLISDIFRFKGYGSKALSMVVEYAFKYLKLNKVKLTVFDFNKSAMKCYTNVGFHICSTETRDNGWTALHMEKLP